MGARIGLDDMEKRKLLTRPGLKFRPVDRPARKQSLHRPRYPKGDYLLWKTKGFAVCKLM
jgi:hypothetical protein